MRWLASLLVLGLVAVSGGRSRVEARGRHPEPQLASTEGVVPLVTTRRGRAVAPAIVGPTRAVVLPLAGPIMRRAAHAGHVHPARGPPRARNAPAIIDS